jgi:hypothetical protein
MKMFVVAAQATGALIAAALGLAATAAADPSADAVVSKLETQGYQVQWLPQVPRPLLPQCTIKAQHPSSLDPSASLQEKQHTLVEIDVSCPPS